MRTSAVSLSKKLISTFFAATLALGLVPTAVFAAPNSLQPVPGGSEGDVPIASSAEGDDADAFSHYPSEDTPSADGDVAAASPEEGSDNDDGAEAVAGEEANLAIPAAVERVNEDVALTQPIAQQESTRSYFLAQTLESTKTVPIVSANLPLDTSMTIEVTEPDAEGEGSNSAEDEGGEDSDESDPGVISTDASDSERSGEISPASTVVGSFTCESMTFAVEPGGESVALVAVDYVKLPEQFVQMQVIATPETVTFDGIDYYSVTRIADNTFSSLAKENANPDYKGCEALFTNEELLAEAAIDAAEVDSFLNPESETIDIDGDGESDGPANPLKDCAGILAIGVPSSVSSIGDNAFAGASTLQYLVVSEGNPTYASYDGALYSADLTDLRLIPEGRVGAVRVAPSATGVDPEALSHCPSVTTLIVGSDNNFNFDSNDPGQLLFSPVLLADHSTASFEILLAGIINVIQRDEITKTLVAINSSESLLSRSSNDAFDDYGHEIGRILYVISSSGKVRKTAKSIYTAKWGPEEEYDANSTQCYVPQASLRLNANITFSNGYITVPMEDQTTVSEYRIGVTSSLSGVTSALLMTMPIRQYVPNNSKGWELGRMLGKQVLSSGTSVMPSTLPHDTETAYVLFLNGAERRSITFDGNKGTPSMQTKVLLSGESNQLPTVSRTGYDCDGWYTSATEGSKLGDSGGTAYGPIYHTFNDTYIARANYYYAHWTPTTYNIEYNLTGGSVVSDNPATYDIENDPITLNNPTRLGYTFMGWTGTGLTEATKTVTISTGSTGERKYTATWEANAYKITLNKDGGTGGDSYFYEKYETEWRATASGAAITEITAPTRAGYAFAGYYESVNGKDVQVLAPPSGTSTKMSLTSLSTKKWTANVTLTAKWTMNPVYKITINFQQGTLDATKDSETSAYSYLPTFYQWTGKGFYKFYDGTGEPTRSITYLVNPTRPGYVFGGYYDNAACTGDPVSSKTSSAYTALNGSYISNTKWTKNATIYAKWTPDIFKVVLNDDGGKGGTSYVYLRYATQWYTTSAADVVATEVKAPTKVGYVFGGYYTEKNGGGEQIMKAPAAGSDKIALSSVSKMALTKAATLYAKWTVSGQVYKITIDTRGGTIPDPTPDYYDEDGDLIRDSRFAGTVFYQWTDKGFYKDYQAGSEPTGKISSLMPPTREGYAFGGYYSNAACTGDPITSHKPSLSYSLLNSYANLAYVSADATIYAKWTPNECKITLNQRSGTGGTTAFYERYDDGFYEADADGAMTSKAITFIAAPTREGYVFSGYFTETSGKGDLVIAAPANGGTTIALSSLPNKAKTWTEKDTLYAYWVEGDYRITLEPEGGSGGTSSFYATYKKGLYETGSDGKKTSTVVTQIIVPTRAGYAFGGYYTERNGGGVQKIAAPAVGATTVSLSSTLKNDFTKDAPLYAAWTKNAVHTITLNGNGGSGGTTKMYQWTGKGFYTTASPTDATAAATKITAPTRDGYTFKGYAVSDTATEGAYWTSLTTMPGNTEFTKNTTLYAVWEKNAVRTIALNGNGGSGGTTKMYQWTGKGWYTTASPTDTTSVATKITAPTRDGYTFKGYATSSTATEGVYWTSVSTMPGASEFTKNTTLYAVWEKNAVRTITLNGNGGSGGTAKMYQWTGKGWYTTASPTDATAAATKITAPTRAGYTFKGYAESDTATEGAYWTSLTTMPGNSAFSANKTLYAVWKANDYKVAYDANGGSGAMAASAHTYDKAKNLTANVFTKTGYDFDGWTANADGTGASYTDGQSVTNLATSGTVTIHAKWKAKEYTVVFDGNGGSGGQVGKSVPATYDKAMPAIDATAPHLDGYTFAGWFDEDGVQYYKADGGSARTWNKAESATLYAHWTKFGVHSIALTDPRFDTDPDTVWYVWYWPEKGYVTEGEDSTAVTDAVDRTPSVEDYRFLGYYDAPDGAASAKRTIDEEGNFVAEEVPEGNLTWYAHWQRLACPIELTAAYDGFDVADAGTERIEHVAFGDDLDAYNGGAIEIPVRIGYTFKGYFSERNAEHGTDVDIDEYAGEMWIDATGRLLDKEWNEPAGIGDGPATFYAAWQLNDCTVVFDPAPDSGYEPVSGNPAEATWHYGKSVTGPLPTPQNSSFSRNGYAFAGWYYVKDGNEVALSSPNGDPTDALDPWLDPASTVTLRAHWSANRYDVLFDAHYPNLAGVTPSGPELREVKDVAYDSELSLTTPGFGAYEFAGWYVNDVASGDRLDTEHMTAGRFTPQGDLALQTNASGSSIHVVGDWNPPQEHPYTLYVGDPNGDSLLIDPPASYSYAYADTVVFDESIEPAAPDGWEFEGWVRADGSEEAMDMVEAGGPAADAEKASGFGPLATEDMFFVAKWSAAELSTTLSVSGIEGDFEIVDHEGDDESVRSWSDVADGEGMTKAVYTVRAGKFYLPDLVRQGYEFKGWKLAGEGDTVPEVIVDPAEQAGSIDDHGRTYTPVFEEITYEIVLKPNAGGLSEQTYKVKFTESFAFPYPQALDTGSVFSCWSDQSATATPGAKKFYQNESWPLAPGTDDTGAKTFGLADLAQGKTITLYGIWRGSYSVEVPLFANLAIDADTGDVVAATNKLQPKKLSDTDAVYRIESLRYEPMSENGHAAFEGAEDVYLSVYAGLDLGNEDDAASLLRAANVGAKGEVSYTDAFGKSRTASPLLIRLGGTTPRLYTRSASGAGAPEEEAALETIGDALGFGTFGVTNPLTIRYGLFFAGDAKASDYAYDEDGTGWMLPENDHANESTSTDIRNKDYGRQAGWSSDTVQIAKLRYTVSVSNTK